MPFWVLEAVTRRRRDEVIPDLLATLGADGGFVTSTNELGGLALALGIELPRRAAENLVARLDAVGVHVRDTPAVPDGDDVLGSLSLRFLAAEPDRKIDIPKVPG